MNLRDKTFLAGGAILALGGIMLTLLWGVEAGLVAMLVLGLMVVVLMILQRRQVARLQQRTLALIKSQRDLETVMDAIRTDSTTHKELLGRSQTGVQQDVAVSTNKIVGLLQAQHVALELLSQRFDRFTLNDN